MEDVRDQRGADIASAHNQVVDKMKLELNKRWESGKTTLKKLSIHFLRDTVKLNEFKIAHCNRFQTS